MEIWKRFGLVFVITFSLSVICLVWFGAPSQPSFAAAPIESPQVASRLPDGLAVLTSSVVYLPLMSNEQACPTSSENAYALVQLLENSPRPPYPDQFHADLNLAYRGYEPVTGAALALLVDPPVRSWPYSTTKPLNAPKLSTLFNANPRPAIVSTDQVYDWDWSQSDGGSRAGLLDNWQTTLIGLENMAGDTIFLPSRATEIYTGGYKALVLYADETQLTVTYEHTDSVAIGYSIHLENLCVDANLLALYRSQIMTDGLRATELLPGLQNGQPLGTSRGSPLKVATRYYGNFMDPRSAKDWWQR